MKEFKIVASLIAGLALTPLNALGAIDIRYTPSDQTVCVGDIVEIDIVLSADGAACHPGAWF